MIWRNFMGSIFAFVAGMIAMFVVTYLMIWAINRYTNPGVRYRENSEYHDYGGLIVFGYIISAVGIRLIGGDEISIGYLVWILFSGVMVWVASIMALIDSDSGSSLFTW
jgi:hypothetical protein